MPEQNFVKRAPFRNILSIAKTNIALLLMDNDEMVRLLKYNGADALNESNPVTDEIRVELFSQASPGKRVFLTAYNGETITDERSEIHMSYDTVSVRHDSTTKTPLLKIDVVVADKINPLADELSLRHDYLFQKITDIIEGNPVGSVGHVALFEAKEWVLADNSFCGWSAYYHIGEVKV